MPIHRVLINHQHSNHSLVHHSSNIPNQSNTYQYQKNKNKTTENPTLQQIYIISKYHTLQNNYSCFKLKQPLGLSTLKSLMLSTPFECNGLFSHQDIETSLTISTLNKPRYIQQMSVCTYPGQRSATSLISFFPFTSNAPLSNVTIQNRNVTNPRQKR